MLFHVTLTVQVPGDLSAAQFDHIKRLEKERVLDLQQQGKWLHLWRVAGQYASVGILDVVDNDELHELLSGLPLFRYMAVEVKPLARHPSALA